MNLFKDVFDAIERAVKAVKAIANLTKETREELRNVFDETFKLLDTSLNMVSIRLGEIFRIDNDPDFMNEVSMLNSDAVWTQAEREFRLCRSLRHAVSETGRLRNELLHKISIQDWDEMHAQMIAVLQGEDRLGNFIADKFQALSVMAMDRGGTVEQVKQVLKDFQTELNGERRRLIKMEMDLYDSF